MKRRLSAVLLLIPITAAGGASLASGRVAASASIAPPYYQGAQSAGVIPESGSPVRVLSETLTFTIGTLPKEPDDLSLGVGAEMTAEYRLQNPTDADMSFRLFLPVGVKTDYASGLPDGGTAAIAADGMTVEPTVRYTYSANDLSAKYYGSYDIADAVPKDTYDESVFARDTQVHIYRYRVTVPQVEDADSCYFLFSYTCNTRKTRVINFSGFNGVIYNGRGYSVCSLPTGQESEVTVVAFGEMPSNIVTHVSLSRAEGSAFIPGANIESEEEQTTFEVWVSSMYKEACEVAPINEMDWYNIVAAAMEDDTYLSYLPVTEDGAQNLLDALRCWYEYELTVPANGTLVHTVSQPVFPDMLGEPCTLWAFEYGLSTDTCWADFGSLTIHIDTDYILESSSFTFTKREGGYTYTHDGLPMGDLSFTLAETENVAITYDPYDGGFSTLTSVLILLGAVAGIVVVTVVVVLVIRHRNKKAVEEQQRRLDGMRAQNGKVDIDRDPPGGEADKK